MENGGNEDAITVSCLVLRNQTTLKEGKEVNIEKEKRLIARAKLHLHIAFV